MVSMEQLGAALQTGGKPSDAELDVYGLTHRGHHRASNQDHFLICALRRQVDLYHTSLPNAADLAQRERLAFLAMVADGVSGDLGEEASRRAVEGITRYVTQSVRCVERADEFDEERLAQSLEEAALLVHAGLLEQGTADAEPGYMATTLTLWLTVWPHAYLLQVGDSRCYVLRDDKLIQLSRDQTFAQDLIDAGALARSNAQQSRLAHILSSAIGGPEAAPVVTRLHQPWSSVNLLCSDGLTKHVPDARIAERLQTMTSAKQVCEGLLQDALDGGGSDNITIIVGRAVRRTP